MYGMVKSRAATRLALPNGAGIIDVVPLAAVVNTCSRTVPPRCARSSAGIRAIATSHRRSCSSTSNPCAVDGHAAMAVAAATTRPIPRKRAVTAAPVARAAR